MSYRARAQERATNLQEQEVHQYYQPWLASQGSRVNVASNVDSIAKQDLQDGGYRPRASTDRALMAFAQLACLRLNVRRAMVSLIDSRHQYILAEATRSVSLISESRHQENDELWLGNTILNRDDAVCHHTFTSQYTTTKHDGLPHEARGLVINDCRLDNRFKDRSYVQAEPGVRFYAGVPIVTRSGHAIGAYAVSDENPRDGLSHDDFVFMQDLAIAVSEHLEWARDRVDRFKGERLVRGLANFIDISSPSSQKTVAAQKVGRDGVEYSYEEDSAMSASGNDEPFHRTRRTGTNGARSATARQQRPRPSETTDTDGDTSSVCDSPDADRSKTRQRAPSETDTIETILSRAARVLRKSTLADGVVFLGKPDASLVGAGLTSVDETQESSFAGDEAESSGEEHIKRCGVLGTSLGSRGENQSITTRPISFQMLERYARVFPDGKTFHFTTHGLGLDSDDSATESNADSSRESSLPRSETKKKASARKRKSRISHAEILATLPGARTMIFLPIRDHASNTCVAAGFIWTTNSGKMLALDQDVSYLRAFANSISSEIARSSAARLDRAKTTFIASLSHELRSPLHGILGSVEFLQDTASDSYQTGLITAIANCSRTLMDTLSNLLSYAKVTTINSSDAVADVELGTLVEEVVEAVCAGFTFKKLHAAKFDEASSPSLASSLYAEAKHSAARLHSREDEDMDGSRVDEAPITVLLDVAPSLSWHVSTNPGALRRIIMNLVGNALKYTSRGFIAISLRAEQRGDKIYAVFRVVDSGKGISEDFLKNNLFVPFNQEDTFSSGTGLGLSIVKQLVDSLGGSISVRSTVGQGTEIQVSLALTSARGSGVDLPDDELLQTAGKTKNLRMCILDPNAEKQSDAREGVARLDTNLSETCSTWFGMSITKADNMNKAKSDMFLYTEPPSLEYLLEHHSKDDAGQSTPLIIVCMNSSEAVAISNHQIRELSKLGKVVEVIPQPCGPRKLAKVLNHCLQRRAEIARDPKAADPESTNSSGPEAELGEDQKKMPQDKSAQVGPRNSPSPSPTEENKTLAHRPKLSQQETKTFPLSKAVAFPDEKFSQPERAATPEDVSDAKPQSTETEKPGKQFHVLIVDDNSINVDLLIRFVNKFKFTFEAAYNGQEALDKFIAAHKEGRRFDHVLMDISMPVMDGIEATRRIRKYEEQRGITRAQIVALTAFASADTQYQATLSGVDLYMPKPVKFAQLKKLLLDGDAGTDKPAQQVRQAG